MRFLMGFLILWGVLAGTGAGDPYARWGPAVLAAVVVASLLVSRIPPRHAVRELGLGRTNGYALVASAVVSALILLVWPATVLLSGASIGFRADWPLVLIGILTLHGLAEEMIWRGYVFRRLAERHSFWRAVWWSMPLIAVTHIPIIITAGPAIGLGAMLVAAVTSIPLSRLYVLGGNTLWAPALLHSAIDSFKLFVIPAAAVAVYPPLLIGFSVLVPMLVLVFPARRNADTQAATAGWSPAPRRYAIRVRRRVPSGTSRTPGGASIVPSSGTSETP
jgi:membrane protease YdiL (CAAX protease family)